MTPAERNKSSSNSAPKGDPTVAVLLTWILPGAGHLYLGRTVVGLLAFAVLNGMYWLGLKLSAGMTFEWLDPELRSTFAVALSPEAGNLGGLVYQMKTYAFGLGYPRPFPELVRVGSALCAVSGMLNFALMTHAHRVSRVGSRTPAWPAARAVLLTSIVPGLGHFVQGRRARGLCIAFLLLGFFALGTVLADFSNLSRERHFYYWSGQALLGIAPLISEGIWGAKAVTGHLPYVEAGLGFGCVAGLLNILAMIDAYAFEADGQDAQPARHSGASSAGPWGAKDEKSSSGAPTAQGAASEPGAAATRSTAP